MYNLSYGGIFMAKIKFTGAARAELPYGGEYSGELVDGKPHTLEEVGKVFDVARERIRQIEAKAIRRLRHPIRQNRLSQYK